MMEWRLALKMRGSNGVDVAWRSSIIVIVLLVFLPTVKVSWSLMFVGAAVLFQPKTSQQFF